MMLTLSGGKLAELGLSILQKGSNGISYVVEKVAFLGRHCVAVAETICFPNGANINIQFNSDFEMVGHDVDRNLTGVEAIAME
nr:hypothetical protein CFP56_15849 [Quercus suber]